MTDLRDIEVAAGATPETTPEPANVRPVDSDAPRVRIFPTLFISGLTAIVLLLCVYSLLSIFRPAAIGILANPVEPPAEAKPAWYALFLYEYLRDAPAVIGALTPVVLLAVLAVWPFVDRNPSRRPGKRILALALGFAVVVAIVVLSYLGWAR